MSKQKGNMKKQPPKPKFSNPVITVDFQKEWWRQKIAAANKQKGN